MDNKILKVQHADFPIGRTSQVGILHKQSFGPPSLVMDQWNGFRIPSLFENPPPLDYM